ncbi:MAG: hypothetical protein EAZ37_07505 [Burkholderiales bacterium]|nr:MAG: hypothetical protein EAZ37_07505 [Burkholderiales bacterium]
MMKIFNTEQPDAEDAKVTQRAQKKDKKLFVLNRSVLDFQHLTFMNLVFLLRLLRNLCVFCVRKFLSPHPQLQQGATA